MAKNSHSAPAKIEQLPDAWERFERAVDQVIKSPPHHRKAKTASKKRARPAKKGLGAAASGK